jgi:DNA mismatch repair protein MutS2
VQTLDRMARRAGPRALLLCDELGAGTDPEEGGPLGRALIERFAARGAWAVITTHLGSLKLLAGSVAGVVNGSLEIDGATMTPMFRFVPEVPGASHALVIAERLGLEAELIARARAGVSDASATLERVLLELQGLRRALEAERGELSVALERAESAEREHRESADALRKDFQRTTRHLTGESEALVARARELWQTVQREARRAERSRAAAAQMGDQVRAVEHGIDALTRSGAQQLEALGVGPSPGPERLEPGEVLPGVRVRVPSLGLEAEVLEAPDRDGNVQLRRGSWNIKVHVSGLTRGSTSDGGPEARTPARGSGTWASWESGAATLEVDLRGMEVEDALRSLDQALDQGVLGGLQELKIVHGIGRGVLRKAVEQHLKAHPQVAGVRAGGVGEGGRGVTLARLR